MWWEKLGNPRGKTTCHLIKHIVILYQTFGGEEETSRDSLNQGSTLQLDQVIADVIYFDNYTIVILKPEKENGTVNNETRHLRYYSRLLTLLL